MFNYDETNPELSLLPFLMLKRQIKEQKAKREQDETPTYQFIDFENCLYIKEFIEMSFVEDTWMKRVIMYNQLIDKYREAKKYEYLPLFKDFERQIKLGVNQYKRIVKKGGRML